MSIRGKELYPQGDAGPSAPPRKLLGWWRFLEAEVTSHPKASLLAALSIGVMLGWIIKRR